MFLVTFRVCCVFFFSLLCLESVWPGLQEKARKRGDKEFFRAREDFFAEKVTWSECLPNADFDVNKQNCSRCVKFCTILATVWDIE